MPDLTPDVGGNVADNSQSIADLLSYRSDQQEQQKNPIQLSTQTDKNGQLMTTVTAPHDEILKIQQKMKMLDQILDSFHQHTTQLEAQEAQKRQQSPILSALSSVAGNLAAGDKRLPPIVQALGRANLQMNPSATELGQRAQEARGQEAGVVEKIAGLEQESKRLEVEKARLDETERKNQETLGRQRVEKALQSASLVTAKTGKPMTEEGFAAHMRSWGVTDKATISDAYMDHQGQAAGVAAANKQTQANRIEIVDKRGDVAKDVEKTKHADAIDTLNRRFANSISPSKMAFDKNEAEFKGQLRTEIAQDKALRVLSPKETSDLVSANQTDAYLGKVKTALSRPELKDVVGPLFAVTKDKDGAWEVKLNSQNVLPRFERSADRVEMEALMQHEIPRIMSTVLNLQGGASILRSEEGRKMVAKLGASMGDRPDQILAILDTVSDTNNDRKSAIARAHPKVDWTGAYRSLVGLDNPINARYFKQNRDSLGGTMQMPSAFDGGGKGKKPDFRYNPATGKAEEVTE